MGIKTQEGQELAERARQKWVAASASTNNDAKNFSFPVRVRKSEPTPVPVRHRQSLTVEHHTIDRLSRAAGERSDD